jgi:DNA polymerase-3 subunit gamma/tau
MSYTVLARKYRPQKFSDVIGQDHVVRTLKNALEQQRIAHGYIFSGHRGIGKTTVARILAMALNCRSSEHPVPEPCGQCDSCREIREGSVGAMDVIEIDAATNRGIEEVRGLIATATAEPARDRFRIFILDEAHQVTEAAFNALLKTLEEPPPWVVFMMATTQPEDIPQTIRSRCQHFSFHAVRFDEIVDHLRKISRTEGLEEEALALLAEAGDGSMRDALSILDQAVASSAGAVTAEAVRGLMGNVSGELLERVMTAVHANSSEEVLRIVDRLMVEGQSATQFARQMVSFLRNALVAKAAGAESPILQVSSDERARVNRIAALFGEEELTRFLQIMLRTHGDVSYKTEQRFHLELGLLKLVHAQRLLPLEQLLSGITPTEQHGTGGSPRSTSTAASTRSASSGGHETQRKAGVAPPFANRPAGVPPMGGGSPFGAPPVAQPASKPSPLEADRARKSRDERSPHGESRMAQPLGSSPATSPAPAAFAAPPFDNGSALAMAPVVEMPAPAHDAATQAVPIDLDAVREAVLEAVHEGASQMLAQTMEEGNWSCAANTVSIEVAISEAMIGISYTRAQERLAAQAATRAAGRPVKVRLLSGSPESTANPSPARKAKPAASGSRSNIKAMASEEPVVQRMIEKFGAEIRIVIDRSEG